MRAVVTGGAGFLGSHLCDRLLGEGWRVVAVDNFLTGSPENIDHLQTEPRFEFLEELGKASPEHAAVLQDLVMAFTENDVDGAEEDFARLDDISIDYALMERSSDVFVVRAGFTWDDLGTWSSLERTGQTTNEGNVVFGDVLLEECSGCIVYNETSRKANLLGMRDSVVVITEDALLVCPKDRSQDVKKITAGLRGLGSDHLL